jgi:hypothetical protein
MNELSFLLACVWAKMENEEFHSEFILYKQNNKLMFLCVSFFPPKLCIACKNVYQRQAKTSSAKKE